MNRSFQGYSPRTHPLLYNSLMPEYGCEELPPGLQVYGSMPFAMICTLKPTSDPSSIFNASSLISYTSGPGRIGLKMPWIRQYAAWVATAGIRYGAEIYNIQLPSNNLGGPSINYAEPNPDFILRGDYYPATVTAHVDTSFTKLALPAIAIQKTISTIELKYGISKSTAFVPPNLIITVQVQTVSFEGSSFALQNNGFFYPQDGSDLVIYYLKSSNRNAIFARFERDAFAAEYKVNEDTPVNISRLILSRDEDGEQVLYAKDDQGNNITLRSAVYVPLVGKDKGTYNISFDSGTYYGPLRATSILMDKTKLALVVNNGKYYSPIKKPPTINEDQATLDVSFDSGQYT